MSCGVSRCISVCAGTIIAVNEKPTRNVDASVAAMNGTAPSRKTPAPMPASPDNTSVSCATRCASERITCVPAIIPTPTIALTAPNCSAEARSVSRTKIEINGAKHPMVNRPAAIDSTTNSSAA